MARTRTTPTSDLVAQVQHYSRTVTEAELCRLARRNPGLRPDDLAVIDTAVLDEQHPVSAMPNTVS
jgi:hypothetical protein